ncbi:hypothetical protein D5086_023815 [Populus alba]|uniref:Uncharacterized protein n=1 Tax=Populus alba TaxID=43335 RepID=A0ACC4BAV9_POPAL
MERVWSRVGVLAVPFGSKISHCSPNFALLLGEVFPVENMELLLAEYLTPPAEGILPPCSSQQFQDGIRLWPLYYTFKLASQLCPRNHWSYYSFGDILVLSAEQSWRRKQHQRVGRQNSSGGRRASSSCRSARRGQNPCVPADLSEMPENFCHIGRWSLRGGVNGHSPQPMPLFPGLGLIGLSLYTPLTMNFLSNMEDLFCGLQNPLYPLAADTVAEVIPQWKHNGPACSTIEFLLIYQAT